jgi:5-formyltetrahydrofolate cyclo-ligase
MNDVQGSKAKKQLREIMLRRRDSLSSEERALKSRAITARLVGMQELQDARTVMAYASFRSEVDTGPLIAWCREQGKTLALPKVTGPVTLEAFLVRDPQVDLQPGVWGISEPTSGLERVDPSALDVVIVPGVAFDLRGGRLGYGGGFYDAYLPRLRPDTLLVGAAFQVQVVQRVPMARHDTRVDVLVTEIRLSRKNGDAACPAASHASGSGGRKTVGHGRP